MSKKNLLNETQVRQFMKLAQLDPLTPGFVDGLTEKRQKYGGNKGDESESDRDYVDESHGRGRQEGDAGYGHPDAHSRLEEEEADPEALDDYALGDEERGHPEEAAEDELEADVELGVDAPADEGRMISVEDFLSALESALEGVMGDEVEIDSDEIEVEDDVAPEAEDDFAPEGDEVVADIEDELAEGDEEEVTTEATDELVEAITKRVAARILKSALAKK